MVGLILTIFLVVAAGMARLLWWIVVRSWARGAVDTTTLVLLAAATAVASVPPVLFLTFGPMPRLVLYIPIAATAGIVSFLVWHLRVALRRGLQEPDPPADGRKNMQSGRGNFSGLVVLAVITAAAIFYVNWWRDYPMRMLAGHVVALALVLFVGVPLVKWQRRRQARAAVLVAANEALTLMVSFRMQGYTTTPAGLEDKCRAALALHPRGEALLEGIDRRDALRRAGHSWAGPVPAATPPL